jgi:hypothetical protein
MTNKLNDIIKNGNRYLSDGWKTPDSVIVCKDGFRLSVIAGEAVYSSPRVEFGESYRGPYKAVEVGFPSARPEPWERWETYAEEPSRPTETVYSYVPVEEVAELIASHGGEA